MGKHKKRPRTIIPYRASIIRRISTRSLGNGILERTILQQKKVQTKKVQAIQKKIQKDYTIPEVFKKKLVQTKTKSILPQILQEEEIPKDLYERIYQQKVLDFANKCLLLEEGRDVEYSDEDTTEHPDIMDDSTSAEESE